VSFASKLGYPTFSFDRLGNGMSDHPNSIAVVQCPAQAATVHELVKLARAGASPFPRQFCNLIFVGSSLGSIVGNVVNVQYPEDFNSTILSGFSKFWANAVPGIVISMLVIKEGLALWNISTSSLEQC
jgi:pimeloyl-ACP methyl ester carboxylesterase